MNQKTNIRSVMDLYMVVLVLIITVIDLSSSVQNLIATPLIQSFFSHPGFGSTDYPLGNYTEDWYITTNWVNHTIKINIKSCTIEAPKGVCINDYLYIYDGANETSNELMKSCCGTHHPGNSWESTNEEMYLLFVTDDTISAAGFEIEYWSNGITTTTSTTTEAPTTGTSANTEQSTSDVLSTSAAYSTNNDASTNVIFSTNTHSTLMTSSKTTYMQSSTTKPIDSTTYHQTSDVSTSGVHSISSETTYMQNRTTEPIDSTTNHQTSDVSTSEVQTSSQLTFSSLQTTSEDSVSDEISTWGSSTTIQPKTDASSEITNMFTSRSSDQSTEQSTNTEKLTESTNTIESSTISTDVRTSSSSNTSLSSITNMFTSGSSAQSTEQSANTEKLTESTDTIESSTISTDVTTSSSSNTSLSSKSTNNMLYIIIGCVVAGLLLLILILVIVICLKKNRPVGPKPFLVHDQGPNNVKSAKLKNEKGPIVMIRPPPTPPLHTIMPHAETNIFDLELPEKTRGNLLPPLYSSSVNHTPPTDNK